MLFSLQRKSNAIHHLVKFQKNLHFLKNFVFVNIKSIYKPTLLRQALVFTKLKKI